MLVSPALPAGRVRAHQENQRVHARPVKVDLSGTGVLAGRHTAAAPARTIMPAAGAGASSGVDANGAAAAAAAGGGMMRREAVKLLTAAPASCVGLTSELIGVEEQLPWATRPRLTLSSSRKCHNILSVREGVLLCTVAFGTAGDDDQFLGVLDAPAPERAPFTHLPTHGWAIKEGARTPSVPPRGRTTAQHGKGKPTGPPPGPPDGDSGGGAAAWKLKGHSVTMRLDAHRRSVEFWSTAGMHAVLTDLAPSAGGGGLTAAIGLFNNTATVTALRHFRAPSEVDAGSVVVELA